MKYKQWLWQGSIAVLLGVVVTNSVAAQNQSDTSEYQNFSAPFVNIGGGGNNPNFFGGSRGVYNPETGRIDFSWLSEGLTIDPGIKFNSGASSAEGDDGAYGSTSCTGELCQETAAGETQKITLNEIAELLEIDLNRSLEELATAEDAVKKAALEPRRIVRRETQSECVNPYIRARDEVDRKLEQSREFIERVDPIRPENSLW
ncbi:hypothetical protein [Myxosarcina sp. GI1(2024)]